MPNNPNQPAPGSAVRLIFEYEGDQVRLVSQQPVDMAIHASSVARTLAPGYYVETRDIDGNTLVRIPARGAFTSSREVFPEEHGQPIIRVAVPQPAGAFTVVVQAPQEATHVGVVRVAPDEAGQAPGAPAALRGGDLNVTELAMFPLQINPNQGDQP